MRALRSTPATKTFVEAIAIMVTKGSKRKKISSGRGQAAEPVRKIPAQKRRKQKI
jgi:hypothetical protein